MSKVGCHQHHYSCPSHYHTPSLPTHLAGWIHFLQLEYDKALECYVKLKNETRWSACYYAYLAAGMGNSTGSILCFDWCVYVCVAVISGVLGNLKQAREYFLQSTKLVKRKNNNLEKFCSRRVRHLCLHCQCDCDIDVMYEGWFMQVLVAHIPVWSHLVFY